MVVISDSRFVYSCNLVELFPIGVAAGCECEVSIHDYQINDQSIFGYGDQLTLGLFLWQDYPEVVERRRLLESDCTLPSTRGCWSQGSFSVWSYLNLNVYPRITTGVLQVGRVMIIKGLNQVIAHL